MFSHKTARWGAHEKYGERNYHTLMVIYYSPLVLLFLAACLIWGADGVGHGAKVAFVWMFGRGASRAAFFLCAFAMAIQIAKAAWRYRDRR